MGIPVMILGNSGAGKSTSLRNFTKEEIAVINVCGKPLPFKNKLGVLNTDDYMTVANALQKTKSKTVVIDDCQYLMANEFMRKSKEQGFQKFTDIGKNFWDLIRLVNALPSDTIVYFLGHTETDQNGKEKFKTIGKMLDEKITVEGMFTIVLKAICEDGKYLFTTQTNGYDTVKSPMGMFDALEIENDLKAVDTAIRNYYEM